MAQQPSMIETLSADHAPLQQVGILRIRPVVVDTSFLVADVLGSIRGGRRSTFLDAVEFGVLRPFAARHVWAEMGRKVADVPGRHGLDPELAANVWWELYVPRIRFVDVAELPIRSSASAILGRDPSDAPTVALAGLLAPVVVLAGDRDLTDIGVAAQNYSAVIEHAGMLTVVSEGSWASAAVLRLVVELVRYGFRGVVAMLRHPLGQMGVAAGGALALATAERWVPGARDRGARWWRNAASAVHEDGLGLVAELVHDYQRAVQKFEVAAYDPGATSSVQAVARALVSSARPLTRTELAALMVPGATQAERRRLVRELLPLLTGHGAFAPCRPARWDLGRAGVDFGAAKHSGPALLAPAIPSLPAPRYVAPQ
jgi:hypothetical protein